MRKRRDGTRSAPRRGAGSDRDSDGGTATIRRRRPSLRQPARRRRTAPDCAAGAASAPAPPHPRRSIRPALETVAPELRPPPQVGRRTAACRRRVRQTAPRRDCRRSVRQPPAPPSAAAASREYRTLPNGDDRQDPLSAPRSSSAAFRSASTASRSAEERLSPRPRRVDPLDQRGERHAGRVRHALQLGPVFVLERDAGRVPLAA